MPDDFEKLIPVRLRDLGKDERWLQEVIAENPQILGLGKNVSVRDKERRQTAGGILDLLLENGDNMRWEVEIQLGATDASHIVRTIEYWDIERKRYSQYEHRAVIVAEEITERFFNVIALFNGNIPITAIKLTAVKQPDGKVGVLFTKILDTQTFGVEENSNAPIASRDYWNKRANPDAIKLMDKIAGVIANSGEWELNYTNSYIGWKRKQSGASTSKFVFKPQQRGLRIDIVAEQEESLDQRFDEFEGWTWLYRHSIYLLSLPLKRKVTENELSLLREMFRIAMGEKLESDSNSPDKANESAN